MKKIIIIGILKEACDCENTYTFTEEVTEYNSGIKYETILLQDHQSHLTLLTQWKILGKHNSAEVGISLEEDITTKYHFSLNPLKKNECFTIHELYPYYRVLLSHDFDNRGFRSIIDYAIKLKRKVRIQVEIY